MRIEDLYGRPMDVEWAIADNHIFVVQARPITALTEPAGGPGAAPAVAWKLPKSNGKYMRASVIKLLPDPLSPLFATLGLPAWNATLAGLGRSIGMDILSDYRLR